MIRKDFNFPDVVQCPYEFAGPAQIVLVVGKARYEYASDPDGFADLGKIPCAVDDAFVSASGDGAVEFRADTQL